MPPSNILEGILSLFLGPLVTIIGGLLPIGRIGGALINGGTGALANGVHSIFGDNGQPNTPLADASSANVYITNYSEVARSNLQTWAADTFAGKQDVNNKTIVDYVSGGVLLGSSLPQASDFEQFYKKQMVSRLVQSLWHDIPHYFDPSACVQSVLKTRDAMYDYSLPYGWQALQSDVYNVSIQDIIISSVRAWAVARGDYSEDIAIQRFEGLANQAAIPNPPPSSEPSSSPSSAALSSSMYQFSSPTTNLPPSATTGSLDECGSAYNGAVCPGGLCCSQNGFCGSTPEYCTNCQPGYGSCPSSAHQLPTRDVDQLGNGTGGVLYGPFSATGNWSYSLVASSSTPFEEGAAYEATWQFPVCERETDTCIDLTDPMYANGTTVVNLCCGMFTCLQHLYFSYVIWNLSSCPG
ncbi:hypothetical protein MMC25_000028 [Agyrium rufum]|nr:hypothetical protein [Agyrium rufum]